MSPAQTPSANPTRAPGPPGKEASQQHPSTGQTARSMWLAAYNLVSATLWAIVFGRVVSIAPAWGNAELMRSTGTFTRWVQTMAVVEIFHSLFGLVRAPVLTTAMQVWSRLVMVHVLWPNFPDLAASSWPNATMLFAWSLTEVVRYSYFFGLLGGLDALGGLPAWLKWLRYNGFWVLYPIGIASECALLWRAVPLANAGEPNGSMLGLFLGACLGAYLPGAPILYSHMVTQRHRTAKRDRAVGKLQEEKNR